MYPPRPYPEGPTATNNWHNSISPPTPQAPEQRHVELVNQGRPVNLEGVGKANPGNEADRRQAGAIVAQPVAKGVGREQERQPEANPKAAITATLGWRSSCRTASAERLAATAGCHGVGKENKHRE